MWNRCSVMPSPPRRQASNRFVNAVPPVDRTEYPASRRWSFTANGPSRHRFAVNVDGDMALRCTFAAYLRSNEFNVSMPTSFSASTCASTVEITCPQPIVAPSVSRTPVTCPCACRTAETSDRVRTSPPRAVKRPVSFSGNLPNPPSGRKPPLRSAFITETGASAAMSRPGSPAISLNNDSVSRNSDDRMPVLSRYRSNVFPAAETIGNFVNSMEMTSSGPGRSFASRRARAMRTERLKNRVTVSPPSGSIPAKTPHIRSSPAGSAVAVTRPAAVSAIKSRRTGSSKRCAGKSMEKYRSMSEMSGNIWQVSISHSLRL